MALDSSTSKKFGATADQLTSVLENGGAVEVVPTCKIDELNGQNKAIRNWSRALVKVCVITEKIPCTDRLLESIVC